MLQVVWHLWFPRSLTPGLRSAALTGPELLLAVMATSTASGCHSLWMGKYLLLESPLPPHARTYTHTHTASAVLITMSGHHPGCVSSVAVPAATSPPLTIVLLQVPPHLQRSRITKPTTYHESKLAAREYQAAKARLFTAFIKAGLGAWVEKPTEQDQFSLAP